MFIPMAPFSKDDNPDIALGYQVDTPFRAKLDNISGEYLQGQ